MEKRHRIFIAINLPPEIKKELNNFQQRFFGSQENQWAKLTAKDNLHITLQFLGDLTDEEIGSVCQAVKEVAEKQESFSINLNKIVYGPPKLKSNQPPKFIWVVGEKSEELARLRQNLENVLVEKVSFVPEAQAFSPHITLARISAWAWRGIEPEERPEVDENIDLTFTVESVEVMESELRRGGPAHTVMESHQLK